MPWGNKFPDLKNDPTYLEPRLTAVETTANNNSTSLADKAPKKKVGWVDLVLDYGADPTGVNDSTTAINNAIAYVQNLANTSGIYSVVPIVVPQGIYKYSSTIVKPLYVKMIPLGIVKFAYTGTGYAWHHKNTSEVANFMTGLSQMPFNIGLVMGGGEDSCFVFTASGGKTGGQTAWRIGEETQNGDAQHLHITHTAWASFGNCYFDNFQTAFSFTQKQTYILRFFNITVSNCGTIIVDESNSYNAGEAINWNNCGFHNSNLFLKVTSEINHTFTNCSIDYNNQGVIIDGLHYNQTEFIGCWIEGSNTTQSLPFVLTQNGATVKSTHVKISGGYLQPKDRKADILFKGAMTLSMENVSIDQNRYSNGNIGDGAVLCDDNVVISSSHGLMFHDNPIVISRKLALNRNSDFQTDANGTTNTTGITGFTKTSGAGIQVDNTISFSGTQSLKVNADGVNNWVDLETEIVPLQGANRVYGQVRVYLPSGSAKVNVNTVVTFYADDKTTVISTVTLAQNMDYSAVPGSGNQWYALLTGTDASPTTIPPRATYAKFHVTFGSIAVPFWVDDMILSKM